MPRRPAGVIDARDRLVRPRRGRQRTGLGDERLHRKHARWRAAFAHVYEGAESRFRVREFVSAGPVRLIDENDREAGIARAVEMFGDRPARVPRHEIGRAKVWTPATND